jgi:uncharacterized protein (DUF488 family)
METSNFARNSKNPNAVAISQGVPRWYKGRRYMTLAPPWELVKIEDEKLFRKLYHTHVLAKLEPRTVFNELGENAVLLCWEAPGKFCHRRVVAEWLEKALNVTINEIL